MVGKNDYSQVRFYENGLDKLNSISTNAGEPLKPYKIASGEIKNYASIKAILADVVNTYANFDEIDIE